MIKPITPDEVVAEKTVYLPDEVFEIVNRLIAKHWDGRKAEFKQEEVIVNLVAEFAIDRDEIFSRKLLDFETVYRGAGWHVQYEKPDYTESFEPFFRFHKAA